ncbi:MAG: hypothetical protein DRQ88_07215 [Epsilonproteobacteria bacterium]|nr:MAG: hypothetical protein DRQ89_03200 [Campylobacterota bacterium]RLA66271.1 MAG: hypothetical protein DRQ88_07215 [Campylobacterota bacterium]
MHRTYLNKKVHLTFILLVVLLAFFSMKKIALMTLLIYGFLSYFFRKSDIAYYREIESSREVVTSPVHGRVVSIKKGVNHKEFGENLQEIRFLIPISEESGLYFPRASEVSNFILKRGTSFYRYSKKETPSQANVVLDGPTLTLRNKDQSSIGLQFLECPFGLYPRFFVLPGDRGQAKANFGHFPLGGTVLLYLPSNYEILVSENAIVSPGERLIASVKN